MIDSRLAWALLCAIVLLLPAWRSAHVEAGALLQGRLLLRLTGWRTGHKRSVRHIAWGWRRRRTAGRRRRRLNVPSLCLLRYRLLLLLLLLLLLRRACSARLGQVRIVMHAVRCEIIGFYPIAG